MIGANEGSAGLSILTVVGFSNPVILISISSSKGAVDWETSGAANQKMVSVCALRLEYKRMDIDNKNILIAGLFGVVLIEYD